jgi:hypothetical protein
MSFINKLLEDDAIRFILDDTRNEPKHYAIDRIQIILMRKYNLFLLYDQIEFIYDNLIAVKGEI